VLALNVEPCAIVQCFAGQFRRGEDSQRVTLFLDMGHACTQVVISHGAKLVFARNLMVGVHQLEEAAAAALDVAPAQVAAIRRQVEVDDQSAGDSAGVYDAMAESLRDVGEEILKYLRYYDSVFPARPVERVIFLGGPAQDRKLCQRMAQQLGLPAQLGDPLAQVKSSASKELDCREPQPAWAVAIGLSLGAERARAA